MGHHSPGYASPQHVQDAIHHLPQVHGSGMSPERNRGQEGFQQAPLGIGQSSGIRSSIHIPKLQTTRKPYQAVPMLVSTIVTHPLRLEVIEVVGDTGESGYAYVPKNKARKRKPVTLGRRDWSRAVPMALSRRGQGKRRYALTTKGRTQLRYALGGSTENLYTWTELGLVASGRWSIQHEDCAYEVLAQFAEMGCPIAPRWKVPITLADGSRIEPDGAVLAGTPLWGRKWCNVEIELSDRTPRAIGPRCKRYGSPDRLEDGPLLVVAYNERAEQHYQEAGRIYPLRMLTTTLGRLAESGVAGPGVWSHYGTPVTLRA